MSFYDVLFVMITERFSSYKFLINYFVIFSNTMFYHRKVKLLPSKSFDCHPTENTEIQSPIEGWLIVLREIVNMI